MTSEDDIKALKTRYTELYSETRNQQGIDKGYIDDTFKVGSVEEPHKVLRLGLGYEIVNAPADQIVTSNPQAFVEVFKDTKEAKASGERIAKFINKQIDILKRQNPNPFKESVKNKGSRGENYIRLSHNERWVLDPIDKTGMPVLFSIPDPMVMYGSPEEDINGIPNKLIIKYERQPVEVILRYPDWKNPKGNDKKLVEWFEYIDKDTIYCEADGEQVKYIPNPYGIVPAVRKYSGFGRRSPDGELSSLIVSDIRYSRGMIENVCEGLSDISSVIRLSAHKGKTIFAAKELSDAKVQQLRFGEYVINKFDNLGSLDQIRIDDINVDQPSAEAVLHINNMMGMLTRKHPFILAGFPIGENARQQGMSETAGMHRYDTVIENTELEWGTAFEMMFKVMKGIPTLIPEGLKREDLDTPFRCTVRLKAKDPIEEDRLITLGDRLWARGQGSIDLRTFLTEFQGRTADDAEEIIANILVDRLTLYNPDVAEVMGMVFAEESGMERWLQEAQRRRQELGTQRGLQKPAPPTTEERIQGEVETEQGREAGVEPNRGGRTPPSRYRRGG